MFGLRPAPELCRSDQVWFNVEYPLSLTALRGRMIILDFWTACCVNCLHVLPILRKLEEGFADDVVVIGVHSPKYPAEQDPKCVAHAIDRLDIRHPVVHDPRLCLWRSYGIGAWPTLVFIDPTGKIVGELQGEPIAERLIAGVGQMIHQWQRQGRAKLPPLPQLVTRKCSHRLAFPTKIKPLCVPGQPKRWAVADSGHHQIVVLDDQGEECRRIGSGKPGFADGGAAHCSFSSPQGLICDWRAIYVADTGNHAIRRIDHVSGQVTTLAGTGDRGCILRGTLADEAVELASVWDLEICGDRLFFANAGTHQLGELNLATNAVRSIAGSGSEAMEDGEAGGANLAQPTGLALDPSGRTLYFADSESSSVRRLHLGATPWVETLVGAGLFEFGSRDGDLKTARLQHCRGLAWWKGGLVVADTYNSRLRHIDLGRQQISPIDAIDSLPRRPCELAGGEPAGVIADGPDRLLIADTNHHRILDVRLDARTVRAWPS